MENYRSGGAPPKAERHVPPGQKAHLKDNPNFYNPASFSKDISIILSTKGR